MAEAPPAPWLSVARELPEPGLGAVPVYAAARSGPTFGHSLGAPDPPIPGRIFTRRLNDLRLRSPIQGRERSARAA